MYILTIQHLFLANVTEVTLTLAIYFKCNISLVSAFTGGYVTNRILLTSIVLSLKESCRKLC